MWSDESVSDPAGESIRVDWRPLQDDGHSLPLHFDGLSELIQVSGPTPS